METSPLRLLVSSLVLVGGCGGGAELILPGDGEPAAIAVVDGDGQSGKVGEPLSDPIVFQVTDSRGRPVEGVPVAFDVTSTPGADVVPPTSETNSDGLVDAQVVLGRTIGQQQGEAHVVTGDGRQPITTGFSAMALPENANSMAAVGGQDQSGHVGQLLADQLVVEVTDEFGNPVAGIPISWSTEGGGSVSQALVTTGDDGRARVDRILGSAVGPQATIATSVGLAGSPVTFAHTAVAGDASRLVIVAGNDQTAPVGSTLPTDLAVQLVDPDGNGVPGTPLSWVVAVGGGSAAPVNTTTDAQGVATTRWTLGGGVGTQRIDAVVSGVGFISFRATATTTIPPSLVIRTQPSANARNGVPFDRQPMVQLRNASGADDAVAGIQVRASLGSGGGELLGTLVRTTDAAGRASFTDLAISGDAGVRTLRFDATGYAGVSSSQINVAAAPVAPTVTTITSDQPDPSVAGSTVTINVQVTSSGGTPTGSVTVRVSGSSPPPPCTVTLSNGTGSCQMTLNVVGDRLFTATYSGSQQFAGSQDTEAHVVIPAAPDNEPPDADFNWHCEGLTCDFTDGSEDDDGDVVAWNWSFGDGSSSTLQNPTHTYSTPGEYEVTLTVNDNGGAADQSVAEVDVEAPPPPPPGETNTTITGDTPDPSNPGEPVTVSFTVSASSGTPTGTVTVSDPQGGGCSGSAPSGSCAYTPNGTGTRTITATYQGNSSFEGSSGAAQHTVSEPPNQPPTAEFTWSCDNLSCDFEDQSSDPDGDVEDRGWQFGDGATAGDDDDPSHTYGSAGTYTVRLTVTDDDGASDVVEHAVSVEAPNQAPQADFTWSCTNLDCQFTDQSTDSDGTIASWDWDFDDSGSGSGVPNPQHSFSEPGTYTVRLDVEDNDGSTDRIEHEVTVTVPPPPNQPPTAAFSSASCTTGQPCQFSSAGSTDSDGSIVAWAWNFGDPGSPDNESSSENPTYTYAAAGDYLVSLTVTDDDGATDTTTETVSVQDPAPAGAKASR